MIPNHSFAPAFSRIFILVNLISLFPYAESTRFHTAGAGLFKAGRFAPGRLLGGGGGVRG